MNVKYVTVPKCVDCQKDCEKADYTFFGESKVCKHGKGFIVCGIAPEKRKPLSDGTLELTESELKEFALLFNNARVKSVKKVYLRCGKILADLTVRQYPFSSSARDLTDYKAILWLAERFELTSNN